MHGTFSWGKGSTFTFSKRNLKDTNKGPESLKGHTLPLSLMELLYMDHPCNKKKPNSLARNPPPEAVVLRQLFGTRGTVFSAAGWSTWPSSRLENCCNSSSCRWGVDHKSHQLPAMLRWSGRSCLGAQGFPLMPHARKECLCKGQLTTHLLGGGLACGIGGSTLRFSWIAVWTMMALLPYFLDEGAWIYWCKKNTETWWWWWCWYWWCWWWW